MKHFFLALWDEFKTMFFLNGLIRHIRRIKPRKKH